MTKQYAVEAAGRDFAAAVEAAEHGERVEVTRQGRPVAVLTGLDEPEAEGPGRTSFWTAYEGVRAEFDLEALAIDPDDVFAGVRDQGSARSNVLPVL